MDYKFIYEPDFNRVMTAVIIDARASIPSIKNQTGFIIKDYVESQTSLITNNCIVYKIEETTNCVLCGYFVIQVDTGNKTATLILKQLRPAFVQFTNEITNQIVTFIQSLEWQQDYLF